MAKKEKQCGFRTSIGGQALIEGIMMRGPEKDAIVIRGKEGLTLEVNPRKIRMAPVVIKERGCAINCAITSPLRLPSETERVTIIPVAVEIISAGS